MARVMGEAQEPLARWVAQVKEIVSDNRSPPENERRYLRVATRLLDTDPEVYIPQYLTLGPYYHWKLQKEIAASPSAGVNYDAYKVQSAATFWQKDGRKLDNHIVEKIRGKLQEIEVFYNLQISTDGEYPDHFALMMSMDLSFLLFFLRIHWDWSYGDLKQLTRLNEVSIECDILKLENQISLSLLRILFEETLFCHEREKIFDEMLTITCQSLSPFKAHRFIDYCIGAGLGEQLFTDFGIEAQIFKQPHLLGCLHEFISGMLGVQVISQGSEWTLLESAVYYLENVVEALFTLLHVKNPTKLEGGGAILNSYNAEDLEKGGIQFKSFKGWRVYPSRSLSEGIRFNKYSAKLYLPRITLSEMQTEVLFKNMLALEFNDADWGDSVMRYVGLMSFLIGTPEDVRVLKKSKVIDRRSFALTDDKIAHMWKGMCHPIFTGRLEPPEDLSAAIKEVLIRKYYWGIMKWMLWGFYWVPIKERLSKPGKGIALLVGILILVMTVIQTYCSLLTFLRTY